MAAYTRGGTAAVVFAGTATGLASTGKTAITAAAAVVFSGTASWAVHQSHYGSGAAVVEFTGGGIGYRNDNWFRGGAARVVFGASAGVCTLGNGATVRDAVNSILAMWGHRCGCSGDTPEKGEAVGFLNAAFQRLHESGKDFGYVGRVRRTYNLTLPVDSIPLESDVQNVDGRVVFKWPQEGDDGIETPLRPLDTAAALSSARARFGTSTASDAIKFPGTNLRRPIAYFARAERTGSQPPAVTIELAPAAEAVSGSLPVVTDCELQVDVCLEPPRFSCCDADNGTRLPVPHRYAESLVIPLARFYALSARYKVNEASAASVKEQAAQALALLGDVDPRVKEVQENRRTAK